MDYGFRQLWQDILQEIKVRSAAVVAPFTLGGKLNLGSPHIVGTLAAARGGMAPIIAGPGISVAVDPVTRAVTITVTANLQLLTWGGDDLAWNGGSLAWGEV